MVRTLAAIEAFHGKRNICVEDFDIEGIVGVTLHDGSRFAWDSATATLIPGDLGALIAMRATDCNGPCTHGWRDIPSPYARYVPVVELE